MRKIIFLVLLLTSCALSSSATTDVMYINRITKEYQYSDEGCQGWIGWQAVPEGKMDLMTRACKAEGYTEMSFPYQLEISFLVALLVAAVLVRRFAYPSKARK